MSKVEDGVWDFLRSTGKWHFDPAYSKPEFQILGRIENFDELGIDKEFPDTSLKSMSNSMSHRESGSYFDRIHSGNLRDTERSGFNAASGYSHVWDEKHSDGSPEWISRIASVLGLEDYYSKVSDQHPGQVWPLHVDNYHAAANAEQLDDDWQDPGVRRIMVALGDWDWGQALSFGNGFWHHWHRGEILYFDWLVPHGSANWGISPRRTLQVTGTVTDQLRDWVDSGERRSITA